MMLSWCFSGLLTSFRDFLADDSGYVQPREGLGLGWVAGALAALAVLFHAPAAQAQEVVDDYLCAGFKPGEYGWQCTLNDFCDGGPYTWQFYVRLDPATHQCIKLDQRCYQSACL